MDEITPEELQDMRDNDDPVIIDVLPHKYFRKQHIPGALNIEGDNLDLAEQLLDKDRPIVVYCMDDQCGASPQAAKNLEAKGFKNVYDLPSGIEGWKEAGYPVQTSV
jgi:rhodanese-related sulfurtransferase